MKKKLSRQEFALNNPYVELFEYNPGIKKIVHVGGLRISSVLCIDAFGEKPIWHASGSILDAKSYPVTLFGNVSTNDFEILMNHLINLLESVGTGETWTTKPEKIVNLYKNLSQEEIKKIRRVHGH